MGTLPGIAKLDFDCKTATVTMKEGTTLAREAVTGVIVKAGFGVTSFAGEGSAPPKVTAYVFRVTGVAEGKHADARQAIASAVGGADVVTVDATGAAAVTVRADAAKLTESSLAAALKKSGLGIEGFSTREWPKDAAVYTIDVPGMKDAAAAAKARGALVALEKVFAAEVYPESGRAVIRLNEPCSAIEANARAALKGAGLEVAAFRLDAK